MTGRRAVLAAFIGPVFLGAAGTFVGSDPALAASGMALVMNSGEASLSVIDMASLKEVKRIPVLREPHHNMLSPDGQELLVGDTGGNQMLFLDPHTFEIKRRAPCADPYQIGFSPDGKFLVVNGLARNQIDIYAGTTMQLVKRFPIAAMPSHVAFSPDGSMAYVSLQESGKLVAIDLRRMAIVWDMPVGNTPAGVLYDHDRVLVANMGQDDVAVVDPVDGHVQRRVVCGKGAHQIFRSPDGKLLYVNNRVAGTTTVLDPMTLTAVRTYTVPGGPDDIAFAPDGKLWFTLRFARKVGVLDPNTGALQTIEVGRSPHGIFLNTDREIAAR